MSKPQDTEGSTWRQECRWGLRDFIAASFLFLASAAVVLWQNAHVAVLWDISYILDSSVRISLGQVPYRDFPLAHAPLTFLLQAAILRLSGRVFFHHVLYAAIAGGLGTVLAWRIALRILRGRMSAAWAGSFLLAAPLTVLGIYSILPFPFYDCDCAFSILVAMALLQRLPIPSQSNGDRVFPRAFLAGAALPVPLFFKQNIGLPLLLAALAMFSLLLAARLIRRAAAFPRLPGALVLTGILAGSLATLVAACLALHLTAGLGNYIHWTIEFASERRLPGFKDMLDVYLEPSLLWWLPSVAAALLLLRTRLSRSRWGRLAAFGLLAAPFLWTLFSLFLTTDSDDRAAQLLALWPMLLVLAAALALYNFCREPGLRTMLPALLLVTINGTLLSQQLWGSTYAIWPLLILLVAEMMAFLASTRPPAALADAAPRSGLLAPGLAVALTAVISATLGICGGLYAASENRLSYAQISEDAVMHSTVPALRGLSVPGPYLPGFEELLRFAANEIPLSDGLILIPGEDPFYYATGRVPQFPVLLFDNATDPYSPAQLAEQAQVRSIRWLVVKRDLQLREDPTPQRDAALRELQQVFAPYRKLGSYDVYLRRQASPGGAIGVAQKPNSGGPAGKRRL